MWIWTALKSLWSTFAAKRAADAAAQVPAGQVAVDSIAKAGDDIRAELAKK